MKIRKIKALLLLTAFVLVSYWFYWRFQENRYEAIISTNRGRVYQIQLGLLIYDEKTRKSGLLPPKTKQVANYDWRVEICSGDNPSISTEKGNLISNVFMLDGVNVDVTAVLLHSRDALATEIAPNELQYMLFCFPMQSAFHRICQKPLYTMEEIHRALQDELKLQPHLAREQIAICNNERSHSVMTVEEFLKQY